MSGLTKKKVLKNFIINFMMKYKKVFVTGLVLLVSFLCVPYLYKQIKGEDVDVKLTLELKNPENDINSEDNPYMLNSVDDFINLSEYSKQNDCYGMYFEVGNELKNTKITYSEEEDDEEGSELGGVVYNLNLVGNLYLKDGTKAEFRGIGQNFLKPFRGNIMFSGITIRLDTPLFCFLGSGASIEELNLFGKIYSDKMNKIVDKNASLGALASMVVIDSTYEDVNISTVSVSNKTVINGITAPAGGLIGTVMGNPRRIGKDFLGNSISKPAEYNINLDKITITDDIKVIATGNGTTIAWYQFDDDKKGTLKDAFSADAGGVIGAVNTNDLNLNVNFTGTTYVKGSVENNKNAAGGVIGFINSSINVNFEGNVDVSGLTQLTLNGSSNYSKRGYIIGYMQFSTLAYVIEGYEIKAPVSADFEKVNETGGIYNGTRGKIFKNTPKSTFDKNVDIITGKGTETEPYIIDSIDDMERLAAVFCSSGNFGIWYNAETKKYDSWFDLPDTLNNASITNVLKYLRKSIYTLTTDIDLSQRGIIEINRRKNEAFMGKIIGQAGSYKDGNIYPTIYQNVDTWDNVLALIPYTYGNCESSLVFKDFRLEGKVSGAQNIFGLIYTHNNDNDDYSGIDFENIEMAFDLESKESNTSLMAGFIGSLIYNGVSTDISDDININFNNIKYSGDFAINSSSSANAVGLIGYVYPMNSNMSSVNEGGKLKINVNNYEFYDSKVYSTGKGTIKASTVLNQVTYQSNRGYVTKEVAGKTTTFYHRIVINIDNMNIHDSVWENGYNTTDQMGGVVAYSTGAAEVNIKDVTLSNIKYDLKKGFGYLFINSVNSGIVNIEGITYDNVNIYKEKYETNDGNYNMGAFICDVYGSYVTVKDYKVNNSYMRLYGARSRLSETANALISTDWGIKCNYRGLFSFEGNDSDGNRYSAVNSYKNQFKYTNIDDGPLDYSKTSWQAVEGCISYNVISNMEGKYIQGTGTADNPFIIDDEAKLTLFSNYMSGYYSIMDCYFKYFSDIEDILTDEEKNTLSWVERNCAYYNRIRTGYYIFANDMDLTEHSYYPAMNCKGNYYGFNMYKFSGKDSLTSEELKEYGAAVISAIEKGESNFGINSDTVKDYKPEIHFAADKVAYGIRGTELVNNTYGTSPTATNGIHIGLHGGLFCNIEGLDGKDYTDGDVNISNIKLSGVAGTSASGRGSSFLISGYSFNAILNAKVNISNIDFQDAMLIQAYAVGTNETTRADGLLIASIENSEVNITGIKILTNDEGNANIRASALIGYQTGSSSKVIFRDIDLNAVIDQGTITPKDESNTDEYLSIEEVNFETTEKEGSYRSMPANTDESTMTEAEKKQLEAFKKYGYGFRYGYFYYNLDEGAAIYYYDKGMDIVTPGRTAESIGIDTKVLSNDILLKQVQKYAYRKINVDVNPESANIIHGSGSKDDPYIIDNLGQIVTLSNFIRYKGDVIDYTNWYVGETTGTSYDETDVNTWSTESNLIYRNRKESEEVDNRIKSVEYLTKAYYKIVDDIDFSDLNSYFAQAAEGFNGIGIQDYPFSGSFVGEKKSDGTYPKILIGSSSETYIKSFSIIQYAKGVNIQNIDINVGNKYEQNVNVITGSYSYVKTEDKARIYLEYTSSQAGLLVNNIIGGDNIIDNVSVDAIIQLRAQPGNACFVGGYVGLMYSGTLTINNIKKSTFENFRVGVSNSLTDVNYNKTYANYISAIVGEYYNGCIIIKDDDLDADKLSIDTKRKITVEYIEETENGVVTTNKYNTVHVDEIKYYNKYSLACSNRYNLVNYNYLEKTYTGNNRIKVIKDERSDDEKSGSLICQIENADQLFLLSLCTNSGSIAAVNSSTYTYPYGNKASTWKIEEDFKDWLSNENKGKTDDTKIELTTNYNMPMFFKYFDFTALDNGYKDVYDNGNSLLSTGAIQSLRQSKEKRTTWILSNEDEEYVYDMSVYGDSFIGIGPNAKVNIYNNTSMYYNSTICFNAGFDGNGHIINLDMEKAGYVGLFTVLNAGAIDNQNAPYEIGNFNLSGSVVQNSEISNCGVGAVTGIQANVYVNYKNITLAGLTVKTKGTSSLGGVVGTLLNYGYHMKFENINIGLENETDENGNIIHDNSVLIDSTESTSTQAIGGLISYANQIMATDINITNTKITGTGNTGGIMGYLNLYNTNGNCYVNNFTAKDCVIETTGTGMSTSLMIGLGGVNNQTILTYPLAIHNVNVSDSQIISPDNVRVGIVEGYHSNVAYREVLKIKHENITDKDGNEITAVLNCGAENDQCTCIYHNEFYELEEAESLYGINREELDASGKLIAKYADCLETNLLSTIDLDNNGEADDIDLIPSTERMDNVILNWSSDCGTMESVINSLLSSLTNKTGLINDENNERMTITVTPMQIKNGVVSERDDDSEVISITKSGGKFVISNNNKFDTFEKEDTPATYSIITIKYTVVAEVTSSSITKYSETIQIPVFINNMVNVDIYSKVMIGQEYDADILRAITLTSNDAQITTKDSSYTVYTEYLYSANRIDFDEELYMNKGFKLQDAPDPWIKKGTKLTLIDLTFEDNPKTYYYEVLEATEFVPLSYFTDEAGNHYKERDINNLAELPVTNTYTTMYVNGKTWKKYNRGVERYLLFVDCTKSEIPQDANQSNLSPFIIDGVPNGQTEIVNKEVFHIKYRTYNTLSTFAGRKIGFVSDSLITEGEINKEKQLSVKLSYSDTASDYYWSDIKQYDYNNQNKYLEVAVYLKNDKGEKVMLPSGTRIMYPGSNAVYESVKNTSAIFYYKDGVKKDGYALMDKTEDTIETVEFTLDFTYAKMDKLPSGQYKICFNLVRNTNKDYPMGDDVIDTIESENISVTSSAEYGFRLDTKGKEALAFNLADIENDTKLEVDFDVMLNSTLPIDIASNKKAVIKFNLYKKDATTGNYVLYRNSEETLKNIEIEVAYENDLIKRNLNDAELEYVITGIPGESESLAKAECKIIFDKESDISNYKLQAELYIDGYKQASDFFIVNLSDISH